MTNFFRRVATAGAVAIALTSSAALGQMAIPGALTAPPVPDNIKAPAGNTLFAKGEALGTQNYICLASGSGFAWTFFSPEATLFVKFKWFGGEVRQQIMTHFLSPNPAEGGTPRATWQSSLDTSAVWARMVPGGSSSDAAFVEAGAIPWLLLQKMGSRRGPTGGDILAGVTYIQRLSTSGGGAPTTGCSQASNVGAMALAPYTADYYFYEKAQ
jgi:hypothetical protein